MAAIILINSLKRLYENGLKGKNPSLTKGQIAERVGKGSISAEEYDYITGQKYPDGETE